MKTETTQNVNRTPLEHLLFEAGDFDTLVALNGADAAVTCQRLYEFVILACKADDHATAERMFEALRVQVRHISAPDDVQPATSEYARQLLEFIPGNYSFGPLRKAVLVELCRAWLKEADGKKAMQHFGLMRHASNCQPGELHDAIRAEVNDRTNHVRVLDALAEMQRVPASGDTTLRGKLLQGLVHASPDFMAAALLACRPVAHLSALRWTGGVLARSQEIAAWHESVAKAMGEYGLASAGRKYVTREHEAYVRVDEVGGMLVPHLIVDNTSLQELAPEFLKAFADRECDALAEFLFGRFPGSGRLQLHFYVQVPGQYLAAYKRDCSCDAMTYQAMNG